MLYLPRFLCVRVLLIFLFFTAKHWVLAATEILPPGFRPLPLGVHALVGGRIVARPGAVVDGGTIVVRDGLITAVGSFNRRQRTCYQQ
jgi:hypothetical protein